MMDTEIESAAGRFRTMIDRSFRTYGAKNGLPEALRQALRDTPRHRFVHRFRLKDDSALHDFDAEPETHLPVVYSDAVMLHVDAAGAALPSSNSQPSYVLWLLHLLGLEPGQRVLEIGSGSGWLAALMGRLVGSEGRVTGVEIISDLAQRSRLDLAALGIGNVTILTGDGTAATEGAPFDRVMVTAATWDVTTGLFDAVAEGGRLLVPILLRGGGGCHVAVLRREGEAFVAEGSMPGFFVPLVGPGQPPERRAERLTELLWARGIGPEPIAIWPFPLGQPLPDQPGPAAVAFCAHLRIAAPGFLTLATEDPRSPFVFGLADDDGSLALCRNGRLEAYGSTRAAEHLVGAYARWADLGMPGVAAYAFSVVRAAAAPEPSGSIHVERRGDSALVWRSKAGADAWRTLLRDDAEGGLP